MSVASGCKPRPSDVVARAPSAAEDAAEAVRFWRAAHADWFSHDSAFDRRFRERFLGPHLAARREHEDWAATLEGSLALLILIDQFPRNAFRGTARMYATDALVRHYAREAELAGHMAEVDNGRLGQPWLTHAEEHRDINRRFSRFPHRNVMLGRRTTAEERAFLNSGGFAG